MLALWGATGGGAAFVMSLTPAAWYRFGQGITVTGAGVSQWNDASGNGRHLLQGTDANRPPLQGDNSILFDGVSDFLQVTGGFALIQPETVYLRFRQVTWTNSLRIADGNTANTGAIFQNNATPEIDLFAGSTACANTNLAVNTYGTLAAVFNGASSLTQVNNTAPVSGNAGASNMGGFTLGAGGGAGSPSNIQVKEGIVYAAAHDQATRDRVIAYLNAL